MSELIECDLSEIIRRFFVGCVPIIYVEIYSGGVLISEMYHKKLEPREPTHNLCLCLRKNWQERSKLEDPLDQISHTIEPL